MLEILEHTIEDSVKLIPFLFLTYLLMEYIEHKTKEKTKETIKKSGKFGPLIGSLLGIIPQCGFSVSATNLYAARVITLGTLISVYLSTSDEMLPIFLSEGVAIDVILKILAIKLIIVFNNNSFFVKINKSLESITVFVFIPDFNKLWSYLD